MEAKAIDMVREMGLDKMPAVSGGMLTMDAEMKMIRLIKVCKSRGGDKEDVYAFCGGSPAYLKFVNDSFNWID